MSCGGSCMRQRHISPSAACSWWKSATTARSRKQRFHNCVLTWLETGGGDDRVFLLSAGRSGSAVRPLAAVLRRSRAAARSSRPASSSRQLPRRSRGGSETIPKRTRIRRLTETDGLEHAPHDAVAALAQHHPVPVIRARAPRAPRSRRMRGTIVQSHAFLQLACTLRLAARPTCAPRTRARPRSADASGGWRARPRSVKISRPPVL